ncbi:hypothetical protein EC973_004160 [Apophysomyces ossiformis]|uniref:Uncharacterized protein n=1 Tax=Apophysomyces ossiformis TaxID=679940 RepID=A0A8H7ELL6_9FUNG|nr:hypothetical protein EC973_004160 [Apophysomyces ossiformis]
MVAANQLSSLGANRNGFSLLLSSRLYTTFIRPKFEYGLAIAKLKAKDLKKIEALQDRCLRLLVGGHPTSSTTVLRHITNLPSMRLRYDILITRFCRRFSFLDDEVCLLPLLVRDLPSSVLKDSLMQNRLFRSLPPTTLSDSQLRTFFRKDRQALFDVFCSSPARTQILVKACRPKLGVDPILYLPATRMERSRLIRWRMNWLPGRPKDCACSSRCQTTRNHFRVCPKIPTSLWCQLPTTDPPNHPIDVAITSLPKSSRSCPRYWPALLEILWIIEGLCNPDGDYADEPPAGSIWTSMAQPSSS